MIDLKKVAEGAHSDFIEESIKKMEGIAKKGFFEYRTQGSIEEIIALANIMKEFGYSSEILETVGGSMIYIQWHTLIEEHTKSFNKRVELAQKENKMLRTLNGNGVIE